VPFGVRFSLPVRAARAGEGIIAAAFAPPSAKARPAKHEPFERREERSDEFLRVVLCETNGEPFAEREERNDRLEACSTPGWPGT
jgi:hypothetical protein